MNQGYSRCSTLAVTENAAITADHGIAAALEHAGVEVLINGQDFSKLTLDTLQEKARAAKIPFNELEMADLIKGKRKTVTGSTTMYRYELEYSYESFRFELQSSVVTSLK